MRIAHITDIHVLSLEGVSPLSFASQRLIGGVNLLFNRAGQYPPEVARALVGDINGQQVDHVVVSGDLTNLSLEAEFGAARDVLEGLALGHQNVTVVPGNHDCYTLSEYLVGNFQKTMSPFLTGDIQLDQATFPFARIRGDVAVVALDTSHPSPPLLATGSVGGRQLDRLAALLTHPEVASRFKLVVMHHPPRLGLSHWHKALLDSRAFCSLLAERGADLVVHGHLHRELRDELAGPDGSSIKVVGANSSTWATEDPERRASYNIYEIHQGQLVGVSRRKLDAAAEVFSPAEALPT